MWAAVLTAAASGDKLVRVKISEKPTGIEWECRGPHLIVCFVHPDQHGAAQGLQVGDIVTDISNAKNTICIDPEKMAEAFRTIKHPITLTVKKQSNTTETPLLQRLESIKSYTRGPAPALTQTELRGQVHRDLETFLSECPRFYKMELKAIYKSDDEPGAKRTEERPSSTLNLLLEKQKGDYWVHSEYRGRGCIQTYYTLKYIRKMWRLEMHQGHYHHIIGSVFNATASSCGKLIYKSKVCENKRRDKLQLPHEVLEWYSKDDVLQLNTDPRTLFSTAKNLCTLSFWTKDAAEMPRHTGDENWICSGRRRLATLEKILGEIKKSQ